MILDPTERLAVEGVVGCGVTAAELVDGRDHIVRVSLENGTRAIVKRLRAAGSKRFDGDAGFDREWAALEHLAGSGVVPTILGGRRDPALLVLAELPLGRSLADSLLSDDPELARGDLVAFAKSLARLNRASPIGTQRSWRLTSVDRGRVAFGDDAAIDEIMGALDDGPIGLVHGDPCPDNVSIGEDGICRIFDFEFATGGPVALDAAYLAAPFPSCWCFAPFPPPIVAEALAAYRSVLPIDQRSLDAAVVATAVGALSMLANAFTDDQTWGLTTSRPRLLTWMSAAAEQTSFPAAAAAAHGLVQDMRDQWGHVTPPMYPAFAAAE